MAGDGTREEDHPGEFEESAPGEWEESYCWHSWPPGPVSGTSPLDFFWYLMCKGLLEPRKELEPRLNSMQGGPGNVHSDKEGKKIRRKF